MLKFSLVEIKEKQANKQTNKKMIINPLRFLTRVLAKTLIRRLGLAETLFLLTRTLAITSFSLIRTTGFIPVIRVLWGLRSVFTGRLSLAQFRNMGLHNLNPFVLNTIVAAIEPLYLVSRKLNLFNFIYSWLFLPVVASSCLKPLFFYLLRFSLGTILTAVGIIWNESLSSMFYIKNFADYIVSLLEDYSTFRIPRLDEINSDNIKEDLNRESHYLFAIGLIILTLVGVVGLVCLADAYSPELIKNTPFLNNIPDFVYNCYHSTISWFQSFYPGSGNIPPQTPDSSPSPIIPESISRSSSGGSSAGSITPKARIFNRILTPPTSRPTTPNPNEPLINLFD